MKTRMRHDLQIATGAIGDILYRDVNGELVNLPIGTKRLALRSNEAGTAPSWKTEYYDAIVDAAGFGDYTTIEAAVAGEATFATIFVKSGTYTVAASFTIKQGQRLIGENKTNTILDLNSGNFKITMSADSTLENVTIQNADMTSNNLLTMTSGGAIRNVLIQNIDTTTLNMMTLVGNKVKIEDLTISNITFTEASPGTASTYAIIAITGSIDMILRDIIIDGFTHDGASASSKNIYAIYGLDFGGIIDNVSIENMLDESGATGTWGAMIFEEDSVDAESEQLNISNVRINNIVSNAGSNMTRVLNFLLSQKTNISNLIIRNVENQDGDMRVISISDADDSQFFHTKMANVDIDAINSADGNNTAIYIGVDNLVEITNLHIDNLTSSNTIQVIDNNGTMLLENYIISIVNTAVGIYLNGIGSKVSNGSILFLAGGGLGIHINQDNVGRCIITNNYIQGFTDKAINVDSGSHLSHNNIISGNICFAGGTLSAKGIVVDSDFNIVTDNRVDNCATGIEVLASADRTLVTGNIVHTNTAKITNSGTNTTSANNIIA